MVEYVVDSALFDQALARFIPQSLTSQFITLLQDTHAVVAGSWTLYLLQFSKQVNKELDSPPFISTWQPKDMDLWVDQENAPEIHDFFKTHGREIVSEREMSELVHVKTNEDVRMESRSVVYQIGECDWVEVIALADRRARTLGWTDVFNNRFDLSICACYWDGRICFTDFFNDILDRQIRTINSAKEMTSEIKRQNRITKYKDRGFTLLTNPKEHPPKGETKGIDIQSFQKIRDTRQRLEDKFLAFQLAHKESSLTLLLCMKFLSQTSRKLKEEERHLSGKMWQSQRLYEETSKLQETVKEQFKDDEELADQFLLMTSHAKKMENQTTSKLRLLQAEIKVLGENLRLGSIEEGTFPTCRICYNEPVEYVVKDCGHTFCGVCIWGRSDEYCYRCSYCSCLYNAGGTVKMFSPS